MWVAEGSGGDVRHQDVVLASDVVPALVLVLVDFSVATHALGELGVLLVECVDGGLGVAQLGLVEVVVFEALCAHQVHWRLGSVGWARAGIVDELRPLHLEHDGLFMLSRRSSERCLQACIRVGSFIGAYHAEE